MEESNHNALRLVTEWMGSGSSFCHRRPFFSPTATDRTWMDLEHLHALGKHAFSHIDYGLS